MILCDEWSEAQVKAFRLMVNRSVTWADWDDELLALELQELNAADFDLSLTAPGPRAGVGYLWFVPGRSCLAHRVLLADARCQCRSSFWIAAAATATLRLVWFLVRARLSSWQELPERGPLNPEKFDASGRRTR